MTTSRFSAISGPPFLPINPNQSSTGHLTVSTCIISYFLFSSLFFLGEKLDNRTVPKKENTMVILIVPLHKLFGVPSWSENAYPCHRPKTAGIKYQATLPGRRRNDFRAFFSGQNEKIPPGGRILSAFFSVLLPSWFVVRFFSRSDPMGD